ncbi:18358_t:CDS:2 [Funneliformis geosporum]|nr:18358_t:CDS:2 [Funneliformis geosporum]
MTFPHPLSYNKDPEKSESYGEALGVEIASNMYELSVNHHQKTGMNPQSVNSEANG